MISTLLALSLNLAVAPPIGGPAESSSLHAAPVAPDGERPTWGIVRRAISRDKATAHSKSLTGALAGAAHDLPRERLTRPYSPPLLTPARPAAAPSSQRDPPSRDQVF
jgi:hypothetical protein